MATHHDNFFLWDTELNPWNSVDMGPHKDVVGLWQKAAQKQGLYFGVSEHLGRTYTWLQTAHGADVTGPKKGVPYDGNDPRWESLYHHKAAPGDKGKFTTDTTWQREWYDCIRELLDKYNPDLLYSDSGLPFDKVGRTLVAHFYNTSIDSEGVCQGVYTCKHENKDWYVRDFERGSMDNIYQLPWQTDTSIGDWFYKTGQEYMTSKEVIQLLVDVVSKNGNLLLNVVQTPEGDLEQDVLDILEGIAVWIKDNGEAIYGSRPWKIYGEGPSLKDLEAGTHGGIKDVRTYQEGDFRFTTKDGKLYVFCMEHPLQNIRVNSLGTSSSLFRPVASVRMLGSNKKMQWEQQEQALIISKPVRMPDYATTVYEITFEEGL